MKRSELEDHDLLQRFRNKETKELAFKELVEKYQKRIYWHIRRLVICHEDADDVVQNVFIKIWQNLESFKENAQLYTWIYRIATNETISFLNRKRLKSTEDIESHQYYLENKLSESDYIDGNTIQMKLQKAILTLPDKQRIVFNMKYFNELKYEEMSEILATSVGALKSSYHHAVKKIEEYLNTQE